jgi:Putative MetA-pathway of phenol degradation
MPVVAKERNVHGPVRDANCACMAKRSAQLGGVVLVAAFAVPPGAWAQEIEPRAFAPSPAGVTFVVAAYNRSEGGVLTDPSLPVDDVEAVINGSAIGLGHTFSLAGHLASATIVQPWVSAHVTGTLDGENAEASRSGNGDLKLRFVANLIGAPALTPADFARRTPATTVGVALTVSVPTGQYYPDKLINVGTNRWAIKPEIGIAKPIGRWYLEATAGVWVFEDNNDFFGGRHRAQDPLASIQAHVGYTFRPKLWLSFNTIWYDGGRSTINGAPQNDRQSNSRYGLTLSMPLSRTQSLKFLWNDGATTRIGSSFTTYGVAWQYTHIP